LPLFELHTLPSSLGQTKLSSIGRRRTARVPPLAPGPAPPRPARPPWPDAPPRGPRSSFRQRQRSRASIGASSAVAFRIVTSTRPSCPTTRCAVAPGTFRSPRQSGRWRATTARAGYLIMLTCQTNTRRPIRRANTAPAQTSPSAADPCAKIACIGGCWRGLRPLYVSGGRPGLDPVGHREGIADQIRGRVLGPYWDVPRGRECEWYAGGLPMP
jgi:hypothetical protein